MTNIHKGIEKLYKKLDQKEQKEKDYNNGLKDEYNRRLQIKSLEEYEKYLFELSYVCKIHTRIS